VLEVVIQPIVGAAGLCLITWIELRHFRKVMELGGSKWPQLVIWSKALAHIAIVFVATACFLDPLVPGVANLTIRFPTESSAYPTTLDNLQARVIPVGLLGQAGGDRISYAVFNVDGSAEVNANLSFLETAVQIQVFDQTRPTELVMSTTVYLSPFVRRQLAKKVVSFRKGE
jgi:hypothetical protein